MSTACRVVRLPPGGVELPDCTSNLDEIWQRLPLGAYTTLRTWDRRRVVRLEAHLDRLEESARLAGAPHAIDRGAVRAAMRGLLSTGDAGDERRVRLLLAFEDGSVYVGADPLVPPDPAKREHGVRCVTSALARPNPRSKSSAFLAPSRRERASLPAGVEDALMTGPSGEILEGVSSNVFAWRGGALWTADAGVLLGITRAIVLEQARAAGVTVRLAPVRLADLGTVDEAFLTSSTRGVLPVVAIDATTIGDGTPGPRTRDLAARYERAVRSEAREP